MKIFLTIRAERNYRSIQDYISRKFGVNAANAFEQKTLNFFDLLLAYPEMGFIEENDRQIRGFQLTRNTRIFYRIKGKKVIILAFFDVRQDPNKRDL